MITIYTNGVILTMVTDQPAEALIEEDGKIIYVGTAKDAEAQLKKETEVVRRDLQGAALLPGFIDPHSHICAYSQTISLVHFDDVSSIAELKEKIRSFIREHNVPEGEWINGFGYDHNFLKEHRHPTAADLDEVSRNHPILIAHASGHMGVVNTAAMKAMQLDETTPDPEGGRIGRLAGTQIPNGYLEETAFTMRGQMMEAPGLDQILDQMDQAQDVYLSLGITTAQDGITKDPEWGMLKMMAEQGRLKVDVVSYVDMKDHLHLIEENPEYQQDYCHRLRIGGVKIFLDGSPQGRTAWMSEPYQGADTNYCGYPIYTDSQVEGFIGRAMDEGWQLLAHCNGDAAAEQYIEAYARQQEKRNNSKDLRPVMIHAQLVRRDQLHRMAPLNMVASFFTAHTWYWGDIHIQNFGMERAQNISPMRWAAEEGVRYTMHQDTPVILPNMLESVQCACRRLTKNGVLLNADQRLTVFEALKAVTVNAAWQYHEEDRKGTLEAGKLADMVILDRSPLACPADQLHQIQVLETIKEGKSVYRCSKTRKH